MRKSWEYVRKMMKAKASKKDLLNAIIEKHYPLIIEDINKAIFFLDKDGKIVFANKEAAKIFNTTPEDLYKYKTIGDLWNTNWIISIEKADPVPFEKSPFWKALTTGKSQT